MKLVVIANIPLHSAREVVSSIGSTRWWWWWWWVFLSTTDADLCHLLTNHLVELKQPIRGIEILKKAIRKIQLFDSQLTSIHADLCQLCLLSKCMKPAIEFLETDVTGIGLEVSVCFFYCYSRNRLTTPFWQLQFYQELKKNIIILSTSKIDETKIEKPNPEYAKV